MYEHLILEIVEKKLFISAVSYKKLNETVCSCGATYSSSKCQNNNIREIIKQPKNKLTSNDLRLTRTKLC